MNATARPTLEVEYPTADEVIAPGAYTFRLGSSEAMADVEISVDRGPWHQCRHACGFWWYDWHGTPGTHTVAARGVSRSGDSVNSTFRRFEVGSVRPKA